MSNRLNKSNLIELSTILDKVIETGFDADLVKDFIDVRFTLKMPQSAADELKELGLLKNALRRLYEPLSEAIIERKQNYQKGVEYVNMHQPKYKLSTCATILNVTRATLNNWSNRKANNFIRTFEKDGYVKFVLEQDLEEKYFELYQKELSIDDEFRSRYSYHVKL